MEQVTPNIEHTPERTYKRDGVVIACYEVLSCEGLDNKLTVSQEPLFSFSMPSEDSAMKLMNDLYYGEYTGA